MKYIVTRQEDGSEEIFLFANSVPHDCMGEQLGLIRNPTHGTWGRVYREPIAAGYVYVYPDLGCYGRSEALDLESRGNADTALLKQTLGLNPYCDTCAELQDDGDVGDD